MASYIYLNPISGDPPDFAKVGCSQAYQCIDEGYPPSTTDYIYSPLTHATNCSFGGLYGTFALEDLPGGATNVDYVVLYYYTRHHQILVGLPGGGYEYITKRKIIPTLADADGSPYYIDYGHLRYATPSYQYHSVAYQLNPMTGEAWTVEDVNRLRVGLCLQDVDTGPKIAQMDLLVSYS